MVHVALFAYGGSGIVHPPPVDAMFVVSVPALESNALSRLFPSTRMARPGTCPGTSLRKSKLLLPTSVATTRTRSGGALAECDCQNTSTTPTESGVHTPGSGGKD